MRFTSVFAAPKSEPPPGWAGVNWDKLHVSEKAVQWSAYFADRVKVREEGRNRGYWVTRFLARVGLGPGYAWCAAFVSELLFRAGWFRYKSAAVLGWRAWATKEGRIVVRPARGMLAFWVKGKGANQKRHIEIVIATEGMGCSLSLHPSGRVPFGSVMTIGGNTGPNQAGSQEDGDGSYRRLRKISEFSGFIRWW